HSGHRPARRSPGAAAAPADRAGRRTLRGSVLMTGPAKAYLKTERGDRIDCLFNPSELTVSKSNSWNAGQSKGRNAPELRFQGGQSATLSLSLTFDTTHKGEDVTIHTTKLLDAMKADLSVPGADRQRNSARPPWVECHWGKLHS